MDVSRVNEYIESFYSLINKEEKIENLSQNLKVGVDLGTANIVISVLDENNKPITGMLYPASVVRDGLVVDYIKAVEIVKKLKLRIEKMLGVNLEYSATAVPPGTIDGNAKVIANVIEAAEMEVIKIIDEPTAAAKVLGIMDGVVVDVGGGTTGISILKDGKVIHTADEPTGGVHMSLVLAGSYNISFDEAEKMKKDRRREKEIFHVVRPVIEKMVSIVKKHIEGYSIDKIYVVGGACSFAQFENIFSNKLGIETVKPKRPLLVTPLGIAQSCEK
ncbi:ethanolamine utilization protein EutJ [Thermohalobacter berrensis]|uniref:Chaperone protein DnaK n=1 Tax=Thermohalobacter berrensis TaxID=99594 RepID=A0A419T5T4_9FIRM|nr:ethanolamine utilization protein EutJ [Thermohalobacter berrensis]RKD32758.1 ethanolamine utilization protein EutJ [Thermohalobacter berrensis]